MVRIRGRFCSKTWLAGNSPTFFFHEVIISFMIRRSSINVHKKWWIVQCHVWFPESIPVYFRYRDRQMHWSCRRSLPVQLGPSLNKLPDSRPLFPVLKMVYYLANAAQGAWFGVSWWLPLRHFRGICFFGCSVMALPEILVGRLKDHSPHRMKLGFSLVGSLLFMDPDWLDNVGYWYCMPNEDSRVENHMSCGNNTRCSMC